MYIPILLPGHTLPQPQEGHRLTPSLFQACEVANKGGGGGKTHHNCNDIYIIYMYVYVQSLDTPSASSGPVLWEDFWFTLAAIKPRGLREN